MHSLLYSFPNSKIVPIGTRLQFSADGPWPQAGSLLHSAQRLFHIITGKERTFAFAVQDGKVQEVGDPHVVIQEWKIVLRGLDMHEVIFE